MAHREDTASTSPRGVVVHGERPRPMDGDDAEFAWFFRAEFSGVVRAAFLVLRDRQRAEDIAQDAFTQLFVHWSKVSLYERPDAWVRRVAIRAAVREVKRERRRSLLERRAHAAPPGADGSDLELVDLLRELPPQQRAAVALYYLEDRPTAEVADILGCTVSTAKAHLFKARKRLALALGEDTLDAT